MYAFIEGTVEGKTMSEIILAAGGIGYRIICTTSALAGAPPIGEIMRIHTFLNVREDAMELFGFLTGEERALILKLTSVSGIGPRTALGIVGSMAVNDLKLAIVTGDVTMLARAPGVGRKTAQRIALELKDKFAPEDLVTPAGDTQAYAIGATGNAQEALLALISLGYTQAEAARAVANALAAEGTDATADQLVRAALRGMLKG